MKKIRMKYPLDATGTNELYDGTIHEIEPIGFYELHTGNRKFYVMEYMENGETMITLLIKIGNTYAKVPLDNYDKIIGLLENGNLKRQDINVGENIQLAQAMKMDQLFPPNPSDSSKNEKEKGKLEFDVVLPTFNNNSNVKGKAYSYRSKLIPPYDNWMEYNYSKEASFNLFDQGLTEGLKTTNGNGEYTFTIDVPEGTVGKIYHTTADSRVIAVEVLIIPGIHTYNVLYAPYKQELYKEAIMAQSIAVRVNKEEDRELETDCMMNYGDTGYKEELPKKVFAEAGKGYHPTIFTTADGKKVLTQIDNGFER